MMGRRSSKRSLGRRECVQEVFLGMGSLYDPEVAWFVLKRWDAIVGTDDRCDSCDYDACPAGCPRSLHCSVAPSLGKALSA